MLIVQTYNQFEQTKPRKKKQPEVIPLNVLKLSQTMLYIPCAVKTLFFAHNFIKLMTKLCNIYLTFPNHLKRKRG